MMSFKEPVDMIKILSAESEDGSPLPDEQDLDDYSPSFVR